MSVTASVQDSAQKRRPFWQYVFLALLLLLIVSLVIAWLYAGSFARSKIETQLNDLNVGNTDIGRVTVGPGGVTASNLAFQRDGESEPWLSLDSLKIKSPITDLVAGVETYDEIEADGANITLNVDELLKGGDESDAQELDVESLQKTIADAIPAKHVSLNGASITLQQEGREDFVVGNVNTSIEKSDSGKLSIAGTIGNFLGGRWTVEGVVPEPGQPVTLQLQTDRIELVDGQWQQIPGLPGNLEKVVQLNAQASVSGTIRSIADNVADYDVDIQLDHADLRVPSIDLPVEIQRATLSINDGELVFRDVVASTDGRDEFRASGSTSIAGFPIVTLFESEFSDVDVATVRKFAPPVPKEVTGTAAGTASGRVDVQADLRTTLAVSADADSDDASYSAMQAKTAHIDVEIEGIVFDQKQRLESIAGTIGVSAKANNQPAESVFQSFDLMALQEQLEIDATADADVQLDIPLSTAGDLNTWELNVEGSAASGHVSQRPVSDIETVVKMIDGNLVFEKLTAATAMDDGTDGNVGLTIDWPITANANHPQTGVLNIEGDEVPVAWLEGLLNRQIENAGEDEQKDSDAIRRMTAPQRAAFRESLPASGISGNASFRSTIEIATSTPDDLKTWSVGGGFFETTAIVEQQSVENLAGTFSMRQGLLNVSDVQGVISGGSTIEGSGTMNVLDATVDSLTLLAPDMPARWIAATAASFSPEVQQYLNDADISTSREDEDLAGNLAINFSLLSPIDLENQDRNTWDVRMKVGSETLLVKGQRLREVRVDATANPHVLNITQASMRIGKVGDVSVDGSWDIDRGTGTGEASWHSVPFSWLTNIAQVDVEGLEGSTSGKAKLATRPNPGDDELPFDIQGRVAANRVSYSGVSLEQLAVDVSTVGKQIRLDDFDLEDDLRSLNVTGVIDTDAPVRWTLKGKLQSLPLSNLFDHIKKSPTARRVPLTGIADGQFSVSGNLKNASIATVGKLEVKSTQFGTKQISPMSAAWSFDSRQEAPPSLSLVAFGGQFVMSEYRDFPQKLAMKLIDIDAGQVRDLLGLGADIKGSVSGDALIENWEDEEQRSGSLKLEAERLNVADTELGKANADVDFADGQFTYRVGGRLLDGKLEGKGASTVDFENLDQSEFPINVNLTNVPLNQLHTRSSDLRSLRHLDGTVSIRSDAVIRADAFPEATSAIRIDDVRWKNQLLTRRVSATSTLRSKGLEIENLRVDLKQGDIGGKVFLPLGSSQNGRFEVKIRQFDLVRLMEIVSEDPVRDIGLIDGRFSGSIGSVVSGQGVLGLTRSKKLGINGSALQLPLQFRVNPKNGNVHLELRRTKFRLFGGTINGKALVDIGAGISVDTDLDIDGIDTGEVISSLAGYSGAGAGTLSGRLVLNGTRMTSAKSLRGSFKGNLENTEVFSVPSLDRLGILLGGNQLQRREFDSDEIDIQLSQGRMEIRQLNLASSLARIAVTGDVFTDGRLALDVIGRISNFNQPTIIEQAVNSRLNIRGNPASALLQAADFLSGRVVAIDVGGTVSNPQFRINTGKQLREEVIRYLLPNTQNLPQR